MPNAQLITENTQALLHKLVMDANSLKQHTSTLVSQLELIDPIPSKLQWLSQLNQLATQINALTILKEEMGS